MDNIIARIMDSWLSIYSSWIPDDIVEVKDIVDYDLTKFVRYPKVLLGILDQPDFFLNLEPITGAVEYVAKINEIADVSIVSQPPDSNFGIADKKKWLKKYFPQLKADQIWMGYKKYQVDGDIIIDDNPKHLASWKNKHPNGKTMTLNYEFTKNVEADYHFDIHNGWENIYKTILKLSER